MRVCFARTRYEYESYRDFWALVRLGGFPTCYVDEIRLDEEMLYVVCPVNGEFRPHIQNEQGRVPGHARRAIVVWWNLERPDSGDGRLSHLLGTMVCNTLDEILDYADAVWVSDRYLWQLAAGNPRHLFVPLGSHPSLADTSERLPIAFDVCHLSYPSGRRARLYAQLQGLRVAPNAWGQARDEILRSSLLMLNVHQTEAPIGSPLRFALAAAYRLPLISEQLADPYPLVPGEHLFDAQYPQLARQLRATVEMSNATEGIGDALHTLLCEEWPFTANVADAAERTREYLGR